MIKLIANLFFRNLIRIKSNLFWLCIFPLLWVFALSIVFNPFFGKDKKIDFKIAYNESLRIEDDFKSDRLNYKFYKFKNDEELEKIIHDKKINLIIHDENTYQSGYYAKNFETNKMIDQIFLGKVIKQIPQEYAKLANEDVKKSIDMNAATFLFPTAFIFSMAFKGFLYRNITLQKRISVRMKLMQINKLKYYGIMVVFDYLMAISLTYFTFLTSVLLLGVKYPKVDHLFLLLIILIFNTFNIILNIIFGFFSKNGEALLSGIGNALFLLGGAYTFSSFSLETERVYKGILDYNPVKIALNTTKETLFNGNNDYQYLLTMLLPIGLFALVIAIVYVIKKEELSWL